MTLTFKRPLLLLVAATFAAAVPVSAGSPPSAVLAEVAGQQVTTEEFIGSLVAYRTSGDAGKMAKTISPEGQEEILKELIDKRLLAGAARDRKLDADPAVKRRLEAATAAILAQAYVERELAAVDLSDDRLKTYYEAHPVEFRDVAKIRARHIVTATREEAEDVLRKIKAGGDFAALAAALNTDSTKSRSGDLGLVPRGYMVKEFDDALFSLRQGEVSGIVKTRFGHHIIKAEEVVGEKIRPFADVKDEAKRKVLEKRLAEIREELRKNAEVKINREALGKMITQ
jgi:peptidyl-prolyl cis-trans isomerase C